MRISGAVAAGLIWVQVGPVLASQDAVIPMTAPKPVPVPVARPMPVEKNVPDNIAASNISKQNGADNICLKSLRKIAEFEMAPQPDVKDAGCKFANPVSLVSIKGRSGNIEMPRNMLNACAFALEFSTWIGDVADPLAVQHLGSNIASIRSGPGFVCRRRNNKPTGKMSEHAFGNAIDITGFRLADGSNFAITDPAQMEAASARFFRALRKTSCGYFSTVLGPGSNQAHASHLHLDLGVHGKTGNYKICE